MPKTTSPLIGQSRSIALFQHGGDVIDPTKIVVNEEETHRRKLWYGAVVGVSSKAGQYC